MLLQLFVKMICLPFFYLTDREFHAMVGSWPDRRHDLGLYDLLPNPNKFDECDPDLMLNTPCSEYYSVRSFNKMLVNSDAKSFSILHCNIRSLSKNLNLLEELLCSLDSKLACSKRSDSGERCGVKKAMNSSGGLGREVRERL